MTKFNTYLESNDFDRLKRFFEEHGELQHYRKGNFFARQGEYSSQAALIKDGTFAYTHIDNEGKEHYVGFVSVSYTHLRAHETGRNLVCRLLLEKKKTEKQKKKKNW